MKRKEENIYPKDLSDGFVVYVTINNRTFIVGEYQTTKKKVAMRAAMLDLATILGLRAFPVQPNDPRPFLALSTEDLLDYYANDEHRDIVEDE